MNGIDAGPVTVLGAGGFIGRHLVRSLRRAGRDCAAPARDDEAVFARPLGHVVYAIGLTADFRARPLETAEAHVCLLRRLLQEADFRSLTYLSSTRVYAGAGATAETTPLRVDPNAPGDLYNLTKLTGESLCLHGGRGPARVARLSNVVGAGAGRDSFIGQLIEEGRRGGRVALRTTLDSRKDYLWVDDAVRAIATLARSGETGIFNVAAGTGTSNAEVARALTRELGFELTVAPDAARWDFADIDISRMRARFGFTPRQFADFFPEFLRAGDY